jgi:hypothetical protein
MITRRTAVTGALGAMLAPAALLGQPDNRSASASPMLDHLREFVGHAYIIRTRAAEDEARTQFHDMIVFTEWDLPDRSYSIASITRNRRTMEVGRLRPDGIVEIGSEAGRSQSRLREDGVIISEGRYPTGDFFIQETRRIGPLRYALTVLTAGRRYDQVLEAIAAPEARAAAARLYPAEYGVAQAERAEAPPTAISPIALVVGIGAYDALRPLPNPIGDAELVAARMRSLGYRVVLSIDPTIDGLNAAIAQFGVDVETNASAASALFYYAGHAVEIQGRNFLLPKNFAPVPGADMEAEAVPVDTVLAQMEALRGGTRVVILDACRSAPPELTEAGRGLVPLRAPESSYIAYSTAPGMVAADGTGRNSPFARAFVTELEQPRRPIEALFREVRRAVLRDTAGEQTPWDSSSLLRPFSFAT